MALFACIIEKHIKEIEWRYPEVVTVWGKKKNPTLLEPLLGIQYIINAIVWQGNLAIMYQKLSKYHIFFIHSFVPGLLGCFHVLAIV